HGGAHRSHLEFDAYQAQVFDGTCAADTPVADKGGWLSVELGIGVVECVLQDTRDAVVVLGRDEDVTVEARHLLTPLRCHIVLRWPRDGTCGFFEVRDRI